MFCPFIENCEVIFSPRFLRSGNDFGREGLARSLYYSSSQRCPMGLRSGLCVSMSSSSTTNHIFMDLGLCAGAQTFQKRKQNSPNCSHNVRIRALSKLSWYAEAVRFSLEASDLAQPISHRYHTIIAPPPNFTLGIMQSGR